MSILKLMLITNDRDIALYAEDCGVQRIFIDLEVLGKFERQGHLDTHITKHNIVDVERIANILTTSELLVRVNPIHDNSEAEINSVISSGAKIVMLPMFKTVEEVRTFVNIVNKRARVCLLLETVQAVLRLNEIVEIQGIDEIHLGLNDLHLEFKLDFMFEILASDLINYIASTIQNRNIDFGFGGIAKVGEGTLPAELILREHYRLKSKMVILSRQFHGRARNLQELKKLGFAEAIGEIRKVEEEAKNRDDQTILNDRRLVKEIVRKIVNDKVKRCTTVSVKD